MSTVWNILLTLLVLTFIVVIHEYGHFLMARKYGVFVEEFSIGMGPQLYHRTTKKKLLFSIRLLPIGGYCKMKGEESDGKTPDPDSFQAKTLGQRAAIVAAGPIMNFILAFVLVLVFDCLMGYTSREIESVDPGYPAAEAGVEAGDTVLALNGKRIHVYSKISFLLMDYQEGVEISLTVRKADGTKKTYQMVLQYDEDLQRYRMGYTVKVRQALGAEIAERGFFPAVGGVISDSFWYVCYIIEITVWSLGMLLTGQAGISDMTGPIGMVSIVGQTYEQASAYGVLAVLYSLSSLIVLISANLGVLNLFPIPGLDGSRLVFFLIEKIRKKPLDAKVENIIYLIGFLLLFGLMIAVAFSDIMKLTR